MKSKSTPAVPPDSSAAPLWEPSQERGSASMMAGFRRFVSLRTGRRFSDYKSLHAWSVAEAPRFWGMVSEYLKLKFQTLPLPGHEFLAPKKPGMRGGEWFPGAKLNFAQNLLESAHAPNSKDLSVIALAEGSQRRVYTREQLKRAVAGVAAALRKDGVLKGDRVAGVLINGPEALICMLAATSIGAVWSSCSPDFGASAIIDRLAQVDPKIVFFTRAYVYGGKLVDCAPAITEVLASMTSLQRLVSIDHLDSAAGRLVAGSDDYRDWINQARGAGFSEDSPKYEPLSFMDPLFIMFSSGTTGVPKCIVHSVGGTLLQHMKELMLHSDIGPGSRLLYFTTCGWMMWNWMVSALATGSSIVLFDGSPAFPEVEKMWKVVAEEKATHFGTSPKYISSCIAAGSKPKNEFDLSLLQTILSTGAPLLPEHFKWIYSDVGEDLHLASISGGTDIISCFMLGNPELPVYPGEIQCIGLGMAVESWSEDEKPLIGQKGELVCTAPFVSMPTMFWNDPGSKKYSSAYFEYFPSGVWRHGDFIELTPRGGVVVYGRSDATLNPGGVRIGTAELYRQVESMPDILDSLAIGQRYSDDTRIILFVKLVPGKEFSEELAQNIRSQIRTALSPRHVPARILPVKDIPYTRSGKKMELIVTQIVHGEPVLNLAAVANPDSIREFESHLAELTS